MIEINVSRLLDPTPNLSQIHLFRIPSAWPSVTEIARAMIADRKGR